VDPLKLIGVATVVLLLAAAGDASFGRFGFAVGLLIGIALAIILMRLLRIPKMNQDRAFDPVPSHDEEHDRRPAES
jgi:hypothetical protein